MTNRFRPDRPVVVRNTSRQHGWQGRNTLAIRVLSTKRHTNHTDKADDSDCEHCDEKSEPDGCHRANETPYGVVVQERVGARLQEYRRQDASIDTVCNPRQYHREFHELEEVETQWKRGLNGTRNEN